MAGTQPTDQHRPLALVGLAITGVLTGEALGRTDQQHQRLGQPPLLPQCPSLARCGRRMAGEHREGIFEGLLFGLFLALVFTVVVGVVSKARCSYGFAVVTLLLVAVAALVCWAVGGLIGMGLATLSPEFFRHAFIGVPQEFGEMLHYAWVGGSILGIQFGGFVLTVLGSFLFYARWQRRTKPTA